MAARARGAGGGTQRDVCAQPKVCEPRLVGVSVRVRVRVGSGAGARARARARTRARARPKVSEARLPAHVEQHILCLEVPVADARGVQRLG